jgi:hypothetical protein
MIKRFITGVVALSMLIAFSMPVASQQAFFEQSTGPWDILGLPSHGPKNSSCEAKYMFRDGSVFALYSDLIDGELYAVVHNVAWNLEETKVGDPLPVLRLNFHSKNKFVEGKLANFIILNKNTIAIHQIKHDVFLPPFVANDKLTIVMPGSIPDAVIPLFGSSGAIQLLSWCVQTGGKQAPPKKQTDL